MKVQKIAAKVLKIIDIRKDFSIKNLNPPRFLFQKFRNPPRFIFSKYTIFPRFIAFDVNGER